MCHRDCCCWTAQSGKTIGLCLVGETVREFPTLFTFTWLGKYSKKPLAFSDAAECRDLIQHTQPHLHHHLRRQLLGLRDEEVPVQAVPLCNHSPFTLMYQVHPQSLEQVRARGSMRTRMGSMPCSFVWTPHAAQNSTAKHSTADAHTHTHKQRTATRSLHSLHVRLMAGCWDNIGYSAAFRRCLCVWLLPLCASIDCVSLPLLSVSECVGE